MDFRLNLQLTVETTWNHAGFSPKVGTSQQTIKAFVVAVIKRLFRSGGWRTTCICIHRLNNRAHFDIYPVSQTLKKAKRTKEGLERTLVVHSCNCCIPTSDVPKPFLYPSVPSMCSSSILHLYPTRLSVTASF